MAPIHTAAARIHEHAPPTRDLIAVGFFDCFRVAHAVFLVHGFAIATVTGMMLDHDFMLRIGRRRRGHRHARVIAVNDDRLGQNGGARK